jgi:hypothetical protein
MYGMLGIFAEFERQMIVVRVKAGLASVKAKVARGETVANWKYGCVAALEHCPRPAVSRSRPNKTPAVAVPGAPGGCLQPGALGSGHRGSRLSTSCKLVSIPRYLRTPPDGGIFPLTRRPAPPRPPFLYYDLGSHLGFERERKSRMEIADLLAAYCAA